MWRAVCIGLASVSVWVADFAVAQTTSDSGTLELVLDLLRSDDRDMRGLALQQVRESTPGQAATKAFAEFAPKLPPENQAALLDALADRGDRTARPVLLAAVDHADVRVRVAALQGLSRLGEPADVPLLARKTVAGSPPERQAITRVLTTMRQAEPGILNALTNGTPEVRAALLPIITVRKMTNAMPVVLDELARGQADVRSAAWVAARELGRTNDLLPMVSLLAKVTDEKERTLGEEAVTKVAARVGPPSEEVLARDLAQVTGPAQLSLLRVLAASAGPTARSAVEQASQAKDPAVRNEAVRLLSEWPHEQAAPRLLEIAKTSKEERHRILALQGAIRLAGADERAVNTEWLTAAWNLATRNEERRMVLGATARGTTPAALTLAQRGFEFPELADETALAVLTITEKWPASEAARLRPALEQALRATQTPALRDRATKRLQGL